MNPKDHLFGEVAVALKLLDRADVQRVMHLQKRRPEATVGQLCRQLDLLTEEQVQRVLSEQRRILDRRRSKRSVRTPPSQAPSTTSPSARPLRVRAEAPLKIAQKPRAVIEEKVQRSSKAKDPRVSSDHHVPGSALPDPEIPKAPEAPPRAPAAPKAPPRAPAAPKAPPRAPVAPKAPPRPKMLTPLHTATPTSDRHGDLLGRLAVDSGLLTMDQLGILARQQGRAVGKLIGELLVEKGYATQAQIDELLDTQASLRRRTQQSRAILATIKAEGEPEPIGGDLIDLEPLPLESDEAPRRGTEAEAEQEPLPDTQESVVTRAQRPPRAPAAPPRAPQRDKPPAAPERPAAVLDEPPADLQGWLAAAVEAGASDVLLHAAAPPKARFLGELRNLAQAPLAPDAARSLLTACLDETQRARLAEAGELDFAYNTDGVGRFRANVYEDHRGLCGVFHFIPPTPPTLHDLGLPAELAKVVNVHQGLVLITGPAGCGKTSTLAALVNLINEERPDHILTAEDPVEYLHESKCCVVNQRQVQRDTASFGRALRAALREDPDVICIGELRDLETISLALSAAETGHLVLATMHNASAIRAINSLVGAYPPDQQPQVRTMLSESLRAVIAQRLLPQSDGGGMSLALELLYVNRAVANLIRENRTFQIASVLQMGKAEGMQMLDASLRELVDEGVVALEAARAAADNPDLFIT